MFESFQNVLHLGINLIVRKFVSKFKISFQRKVL
jgi:hypothetical protein